MKSFPKKTNGGQVVILTVIFFLIISMAVISAVVIPTSNQVKSVNDLLRAKQGYIAADAIGADGWYRLSLDKTLPSTMSLPFETPVSASATVLTSGSTITITALGADGATRRYASAQFRQDASFGLQYSLAIGTGGISMGGGSNVTGDVYTNGNITSDSSGSFISGSATAANETPPVIDQSNGYTNGTTPVSVTIGNAAAAEDVAQSFQVTSTVGITYIRLYAKKVGFIGSNSTVRIVNDNAGKPGKTTYATGTMKADAVTTSFTYVSVPISGLPSLTPGVTYWLVVDKPNNQSWAYYVFAGTAGTYANGNAKKGQWSSSNGGTNWTDLSPSNTDLYFDVFVGGNPSKIAGAGLYGKLPIGTSGAGSAWAYNLEAVSVKDSAYCHLGTYLSDLNNGDKTCDISRGAPATANLPITSSMITAWQTAAAAGGEVGSKSYGSGTTTTLGPKKIVGNLSVDGGSTLYVTGPIWVTGTISVNGGSSLRLQSSAGATGGIVIADGTVSVNGGATLQGSGTAGSYLMVVSNSSASSAISVDGGAGSVMLVALNGTVKLNGGGTANNVVAKQFAMSGGSHVIYDENLQDLDFEGVTASEWEVGSWGETTQ